MESDDGALPQGAALGLGVALVIAVEENPGGLELVQVQVVGDAEAVVDEVLIDAVFLVVDLDLA